MFNLYDNKRLVPDTFDNSLGNKKRAKTSASPNAGKHLPGFDVSARSESSEATLVQESLDTTPPSFSTTPVSTTWTGSSCPPPHNWPHKYDIAVETCYESMDSQEAYEDPNTPSDDDISISDVCYGVVVVRISSLSGTRHSDQCVGVQLEVFGEIAKAKYEDTGNFVGLIRSPAIRQLLDDTAVQLSATLTDLSPTSTLPAKYGKKQSVETSWDANIRIMISGSQENRNQIGALLSDAKLFLQHPYVEECGEIGYSNPHYLLRPGAALPKLKSSPGFRQSQAAVSGSLDEVKKNRIMRVFDAAGSASSPCLLPENFLSKRLKLVLKSHQVTAVAMMAEREWGDKEARYFPSMWETTQRPEMGRRYRNTVTGVYTHSPILLRGGLLADDMGLGKTLSALAHICLSLDIHGVDRDASIATLVITPKSTLPGWQYQIDRHVHSGRLRTALYHGSNRGALADRFDSHDVILTTYETLRADVEAKGPLYEHQWHRVVLDEAHHIRNRASQTFRAACSIKSAYRWCLTGTPIHNSLDDYGALLTFLRTPGFTEKRTFDQYITKPIQDKKQDGFTTLQALVKTTCLRRTKETLGATLKLPARAERIENVRLHQQDQELYDFFKRRTADIASGTSKANATASFDLKKNHNVLSSLNFLRLICNHGQELLPTSALEIWNARNRTMTDYNEAAPRTSETDSLTSSAKIDALINNLNATRTPTYIQAQYPPIKSVIFTYWTKMLDLIQRVLTTHGFKSCRIDGSTSLDDRTNALTTFNNDPQCTVMLATIGSAGEGLDLTVASHIHLMEPHWNPMAEAQAVDRVYRIGQERDVLITRYIVSNSIETYIQWIQQQKMELVRQFGEAEEGTQARVDMERWKQLRINLGCGETD